MKKMTPFILLTAAMFLFTATDKNVRNASADPGCVSVNIFKNTALPGFWEDIFIELEITDNGWTIYKIDKFKKARESHEKGSFAAFINYLGHNKDYTVLKLYYDRKDIIEDTPLLKMMVNFSKKCLWSKKFNIKVCIK